MRASVMSWLARGNTDHLSSQTGIERDIADSGI